MRPDDAVLDASVDRRQFGPLEAVARLRAAQLGRAAERAWWARARWRAAWVALAVLPWLVMAAELAWLWRHR